jgi:tetratricopeptide (TPR) repeat protein
MRRSALLVLLALSAGPSAMADAPPATSASSKVADGPLPDLPAMPAVALPAPEAAAVQSLEARLEHLLNQRATHPLEPKLDFSPLIGDLDEDIVPAIAQRSEQLRRSIDGPAALAVLERARKEGSKALGTGKKRPQKGEKAAKSADHSERDGDWLQFVLAVGKPDNPAWRDLVQVYGMLRMLEAVGSTSSVREMLNAYGYYGELVRIDLQRAIERLGEKAVPALIEAREHDARKVREWARRELDILGRAIPGEAVSTNDTNVLADVLLAFGRVRDVDAARVVLSFVASERVQLRKAARQSVVALGEPALWHLRDAYESATGEKPPRSWDHKRLAQELFRLHDRAGMTAIHELMEQGVELAKNGDATNAAARFDQVLARAPLFERRKEMAPTYTTIASVHEKEGKHQEALAALRKALRLDPESPNLAHLESRIATLEGRLLIERGTPDPFILKRAVELDPKNTDARELLANLEARTTKVERQLKRQGAALFVTLAGILSMVWLARRREPTGAPTQPQESPPQAADCEGDAAPKPTETDGRTESFAPSDTPPEGPPQGDATTSPDESAPDSPSEGP